MTLLSRSMRSGPREGTTSAVTVRVIFLRVKGKSRNPKTLIGSPFAARSVTAAGGTGFPGHPREFHPCQKCTRWGRTNYLEIVWDHSWEHRYLILRGGIVLRTHDGPKNPYITLFLHTILGPDYYVLP